MIGARVRIVPKRAVLDPQGEAVQRGLHEHGHAQVRDVRVGRVVELLLDMDPADEAAARAQVAEMCTQLLVNDVVEVGEIELVDPATVGAAGVLELDGGGR
jgi:phosphoribosylformylglycinamidine synthase